MIGIVAKLKVKPGSEAAFEAAFQELAAAVRKNEPGCKLYDLFRKAGEAGTYYVQEQYTDKASADAHMKSDHFRAAGAKLAPTLAAAPEIVNLEKVG
ncbi:MAG: antibiotic biosynthesis monooxygenase [Alphaproteobacteria bacterium]|nr:antibiotic biosynthesis monooxygenase [Alphaproteobacteria bacterium]